VSEADLSSSSGKPETPVVKWRPPSTLKAREVLRAAAALFQLSWVFCLPLALIGVLASGAPGSESIASGEGSGLVHSGQWWALYGASILIMLLCYGAVTLRQQSLVEGSPLRVFDALRRSLITLPSAALTAVIWLLCAPLVLPMVWLSLAWTVAVCEGLGPLQACRRSIALVRGNALTLTGSYLATLAAVLVFVMLVGIFFGVVMSLAGQEGARTGVAVSRVLFAALLSLPVIYVSAMLVSVQRGARG